jgi:Ca2+-binding RTX toxin-like protein
VSDLTAAGNSYGFQITDAAQTVSSTGVTLAAPDNMPSVQLLGDVNGDGLADIGVTMFDRAVVVFGKTTGAAVSASAVAAGTDTTSGFVINGISRNAGFGFLSDAGDINGDGLSDMVVNTTGSQAYIVLGQTGTTAVSLDLPSVQKVIPITTESLNAVQAMARSAGDVNGDGFDDLIITDVLADPSGSVADAGKAYIVYGGFSEVTASVFQVSNGDVIGTSGADTINGTSAANQLVGGAGNDLITGNGGADVMYGGRGDDVFVLNASNVAMLAANSGNTSQGVARINGGNGIDTIQLDSASLDLSQVRNAVIDGIERFDLNGNGSSLKLSARDVIDLSKDNNARRHRLGCGQPIRPGRGGR